MLRTQRERVAGLGDGRLNRQTAGSIDRNVFEHVRSKELLFSTLEHVFALLRPGGRLIIMQPNLRYMGGENFDAIAHVSYADSRNDSNVMVTATTPTPGNAQYTTRSLVPTFGGFYDNNVPDIDYSGGGLLNIKPAAR